MAEEVLYTSAAGETNKRKYEDTPSPVGRRATGFSSTPDSVAPPPAYNTVPPPMNEIELAKQKAQEIAARLLNNADPSKRARVENGGGGGGFDSTDYGSQKPSSLGLSGPPQVVSSGYPGSKKVEIPNGRVGVIIGKGGETIKYLQLQSGAKIQVTRDVDADPNAPTRGVELMGTSDQIAKAEQLINDVLSEAEAGGSGIVSRRLTGQPAGAEQFVMKVPNNKVGLVIGKGGETIKNMQARTGARIQVIPLHLPPGDTSKERTVQIDGTSEQIEAAKQLIEEVTSENRMRNPSGYSQQGYQARPPANWGPPPPPMQQHGYGYTQPGAYPGSTPQYGQPPYSGYPQPASSGYGTGWDQSAAPQNQQGAQGGSYDYYNQQQHPQQQQAHGGDVSGYGYGQAPPYGQGQGYSQDGYGYHTAGAQSGYTQPQPNPGSGYDQQQQGYNSSYGNVSNPPPEGQTSAYGTQGETNQVPAPGQSYNAGGQPVPNSGYPPQAPSQPGYGAPPSSQGAYPTQAPGSYGSYGAQKPAASQPGYTQPHQSPSAQSGGYTQPGYPHSQVPSSQPSYPQTDYSGSQRAPSSGYPMSQAGYAGQQYVAPAGTQPGYGQQQPPQYSTSYSGAYSQPPYTSDASAGSGNAHGTYDANLPPQSAQPSSAASAGAQASPPS